MKLPESTDTIRSAGSSVVQRVVSTRGSMRPELGRALEAATSRQRHLVREPAAVGALR